MRPAFECVQSKVPHRDLAVFSDCHDAITCGCERRGYDLTSFLETVVAAVLLDVCDLAVNQRDLDVRVDKNLFAAKIDDILGLS